MKAKASGAAFNPMRFRVRLQVALMVVVITTTVIALYFSELNLANTFAEDLQHQFQTELNTMNSLQHVRQAALMERSRTLVRKSRIHAALEDDALDLLYPSAKDELRDVMDHTSPRLRTKVAYSLHADFYRFLDRHGTPISPDPTDSAGLLKAEEEMKLRLPALPDKPQVGYLTKSDHSGEPTFNEIILIPIVSTETELPIAALVLGFRTPMNETTYHGLEIKHGIWQNNQLHMLNVAPATQKNIEQEMRHNITIQAEGSFRCLMDDIPYQLLYKCLNPDSMYAPTYEINLYPLQNMFARQKKLRWQVIGAGCLLLFGGFMSSYFLSGRLVMPVKQLAEDSVVNRMGWAKAETALESTNEELQRAARFSADASHQLKTPVAVLRAGLEEIQNIADLDPELRTEISTLIHQTYRLSSVIDELLLLSRMDAGRLTLDFNTIDFSHLIEAAIDDCGAVPNSEKLAIEASFPDNMSIVGDEHFIGIILQNLLENARKYNRPRGRVKIWSRVDATQIFLSIGNTGQTIPSSVQPYIFERFHRGKIGENVPGYGLGLNLARELARLHQGELKLIQSDEDWTEFQVSFNIIMPTTKPIVTGA